jgi:purine nucleosidase
MVRVLRSVPEPVTLMVIGPLTTVAVALEKAPDIEAKIKKIV